MKTPDPPQRPHQLWAQFRFSVVGPLLAAPPSRGELADRLSELAARQWRHPITGQWFSIGRSTLERWYYRVRKEKLNPVEVLQRKRRKDSGQHPSLSEMVCQYLHDQYRQHPNWSYQLHADNLGAAIQADPQLGSQPSYRSVLRYMKGQGLIKRPRRGPAHSPGATLAEARVDSCEVRSYQSAYINALWHLDFHHGSQRILLPNGQWVYPLLLAVMDDRSRLCCHAQWYLNQGADELCHGLCQALQKRALPRALMTDNGSAMIAAETKEGLGRLSIVHELTLPYSPYQNGKQETFWSQIEGRLLAMLEGAPKLTLDQLNEATLAWIEIEYNRKRHSEIGQSPFECYRDTRDVGRPCPSSEKLHQCFTTETHRQQRRSDGTIRLEGIRYEIPSRYHHFERIYLRYASWDRSRVYLTDSRSGDILCSIFPLDKTKNAQATRPVRTKPANHLTSTEPPKPSEIAPLLQQIIAQYAASGLPPAYIPKAPNPKSS